MKKHILEMPVQSHITYMDILHRLSIYTDSETDLLITSLPFLAETIAIRDRQIVHLPEGTRVQRGISVFPTDYVAPSDLSKFLVLNGYAYPLSRLIFSSDLINPDA